MDRRDFLRLTALAGISLMTPFGRRKAHAAAKYDGPYWLLIHAGGGWDPTLVCDPKGDANGINRTFTRAQIGTAGKFMFAPIEYKNTAGQVIYSNQIFFTKFQNRLMVINGIDTTTGNHDTGTRVMWSGRVSEGYPTFAALVAAARTPGNPLGFISSGGYEQTAGLVPLTRLGNPDSVRRLAFPNRFDATKTDSLYHTQATYDRIQAAQRARLDAMAMRQSLPRMSATMGQLYAARTGDDALSLLANELPTQAEVNLATNPLLRQAMVALAGFKAGVAVAANLSIGGFDTHGNHDAAHQPRLADLLLGVDLIQDEISRRGLTDKVITIVGSDFGRTPAYNPQAGKDHWNITSMLLMGPGIPGGRLVGATDDGFKPRMVNATTLAEDSSGTRIRCDHIQRALRKLGGIDGSLAAAGYPIPADDLPLFT